MGTIDFQQLILSTTKQKRSFSSSPPFSLPAYWLIQTLKPKLSHGWLTLTMVPMVPIHPLMPPMPMVLTHMPVSMVLDTTVMLLDIVSLARDLLTPTPMLKLSHGWPILTTDMVVTHMLVSMVLDTTVMLLEVIAILARDLLTPNQKLNHGWLMDTTDTTTTLEPDTLDMLVHTATDMLLHTPTPDTDGKQKVKWSKKLTNKF